MIKEKYTCSFIGHRKIEVTNDLVNKLNSLIEDLILNKHYSTFLFGSRSEFDSLCHGIVSKLKEKYQFIKRVSYTCKSESCFFEHEKKQQEKILTKIFKHEINLHVFDEEFEHKTKYTAGRASYVERNQAMIDNSDLCIIYFKEDYKLEMKKYSKNSYTYFQPKSGTRLAYEYIKQKMKNFINITEI